MSDDIFKTLEAVDITKYVEKKGKPGGRQFNYLSWSDALSLLLREFPRASWAITKVQTPEGVELFYRTPKGLIVEVSVTVEDLTRVWMLPVMDHTNNAIVNPDARDITDAHARCLVKCIASHGLGMSLYRGEDLPTGAPPRTAPPKAPAKTAAKPAKAPSIVEGSCKAPSGYRWRDDISGTCCRCDRLIEDGKFALENAKAGKSVCEMCGIKKCKGEK